MLDVRENSRINNAEKRREKKNENDKRWDGLRAYCKNETKERKKSCVVVLVIKCMNKTSSYHSTGYAAG